MFANGLRTWALAQIDARCERAVADRKRALLGDLSGQILELGPGRGVSFQYFRPDILTRDALPAIHEAGFTGVEHELFAIPVPLLSPHVVGVAVK